MKKPSSARFFYGMLSVVLATVSVGCQAKEEVKPPQFQQMRAPIVLDESVPCDAADQITSTGPALLINDPAVLAGPFSLQTALDKIVATGGAQGTAEGLMGSLLESFSVDQLTNPESCWLVM